MSRELQDQLARTYPRIFGDLSFPMFPPYRSLESGEGCLRTRCEQHRDTRA